MNHTKDGQKKIGLKNKWFYQLVSQVCYNVDDFLSDEENMRNKFEERNQQVIDYFKNTDKLLVIDFEKNQEWNILCEFLNKPIPNQNFPHLNRTK